ncbi:hypothetical protein [Hyalangium versicolor]|uniref:hypothetical protein n=1 Tax=Hyalangium versicolor TaxID=2861190 RepID=UPI001CCA14ED|nr:hypothetical protein [Hyalangium versicolor]
MRNSRFAPWVVAALVAMAQVGCGDDEPSASKDSCSSGNNMTNPRLVDGLEPTAGGSLIRITWEPGTSLGAQLPSEYFAAVQVSRETAPEVQSLVTTVSLTEDRQITVRFRNLGPYLVDHDALEFKLAFPDRRGFISCSHPGMDDEYLLNVRLEFDEQKELQRASLTEDVSPGDI